MSVRESLNRIPPAISTTVIAVLIIAIGIYIYGQLRPATLSTTVIVEKGDKTTLKCAECGYTFEKETAELRRNYGAPNGRIILTDEGLKCPHCGQYRLGIIE